MSLVLVTGGAGFIGSHIVDHHMKAGDTVAVIDNLSTGDRRNLAQHEGNPRFSFHEASLQSFQCLPDLARRANLVYHLAASVGVRQVLKSPVNVLDSNMQATDYLFRTFCACNKAARIVIASSSEVYGLQENVPFKETDNLLLPSIDPLRWCYGVTKMAGEMLTYAYAYEHAMNATAIRLFNTAGPRQSPAYGMVLPNFVAKALRGEDITIFNDGDQTRSFSDIRDTVEALAQIARCGNAKGEIVNIGSDHEISINALAKRVIELTGSSSKLSYTSYQKAYGHHFVDSRRRSADTSRLRALTGFTPKFTLDDTIHSLVDAARKVS